jgi:hypothetical protein
MTKGVNIWLLIDKSSYFDSKTSFFFIKLHKTTKKLHFSTVFLNGLIHIEHPV